MTLWQRPARLLLGLFLVAFSVALFFAVRARQEPAPAAGVPQADPDAVVESTGAVVIQTTGGRQDFRIEAERQLTYPDGSVRLLPGDNGRPVKLAVTERAGRDFEMTGLQADVTADQEHATLMGDVRLTVSDGLAVATERAVYTEADGIVRLSDEVAFRHPRFSGSGVGATYDRHRDTFWLLDRARITMAPGAAGGAPIEIEAGAAGFARGAHYLRFDGGVRMVRGGQVIESDNAFVHLTADESRVQRVELRSGARVSGMDGALEEMAAHNIQLRYGAGEALERTTLTGGAAVTLAAGDAPQGRRLAAERIDVGFAPDGTTVTRLEAREQVRLDAPAAGGAPARRITAAALDGRGGPEGGVTEARFSGDVDFREWPAAAAGAAPVERTARARRLDVRTRPGFGDIEHARFSGDVTFEDGARRARAAEAAYDLAAERLDLRASAAQPGPAPRVTDADVAVDARRIVLGLDGGRLDAEEDVRSVLQPAPRTGEDAARRPGMLRQDEPVYVTAQRLAYDGDARRATYTGDARLWQGDAVEVQGDTLTIDDRAGDLTATGRVRSRLALTRAGADATARAQEADEAPEVTRATAEEMQYEEAARRATYLRKARVTGPQGDVTADRVELYLATEGDDLERAEAYDAVTVRVDVRRASGDRLTYFAADERYVMTGRPVRILEKTGQECRETAGRLLTFFKSADTISVDGHGEIPTQTTIRGDCPELPR